MSKPLKKIVDACVDAAYELPVAEARAILESAMYCGSNVEIKLPSGTYVGTLSLPFDEHLSNLFVLKHNNGEITFPIHSVKSIKIEK